VPGYWFTVFLVDRWGRKFIQIMGFVVLTVLFFILGFAYDWIKTKIWLFLIIFSTIQFFCNFGPNATTFIIPGEVFPTRYRSTCHGIAAASGKAGAILALLCFASMKDIGGTDAFIPYLFIIFGVFMFIGLIFTFLIPETMGKSLEELAGE
jgi:PHS family inorganic phosphate transporter-like MFS transporter